MWWLLACVSTAPDPGVSLDDTPGTADNGSSDSGSSDSGSSDSGTPPENLDEEPVADLPAVRLNEVQSGNDGTYMPTPGHFPDWLELHNGADRTVDLARVGVRREGKDTTTLSGTLEPGALRLVAADELGFDLSKDGERIELLVDGEVVDRLATGQLVADTAWARFPDGGEWAVTARPTPGQTNGSRPSESLDPSDGLFRTDYIHQVRLQVPEDSLRSLEDDRSLEVPAAISMGGAWFPEVGVRLKGRWGSERDLDEKCAWKVDLNEYADHTLYGQEALTLNSMVQDPTYVAEHLSYSVFRAAGVPAPRVAWTRLEINGEDFGLYAIIETVDDTFLDRWFADGGGRMWEGSYGQDLDGGGADELEFDEGVDDDRSTLHAVGAVIDGTADAAAIAQLEALLDLDEWLATMAVEALVRHWDGYTTANNYRLYEDPSGGRLSMIPWGTDQTFVDPYYDPYEGYGAVYTFCLQEAGCRARYTQALLDVADIMDGLDLETVLDARLALLASDIASDPRAEIDAEDHAAFVSAMRTTIRDWPDVVRAMAQADAAR